jgi:hypothetical protein
LLEVHSGAAKQPIWRVLTARVWQFFPHIHNFYLNPQPENSFSVAGSPETTKD